MPTPDYYDDQSIQIRVDPDTMFQLASVAMPTYGGQVADSVNRIVAIWNGLKLGWVGNTAKEAQEFNDLWTTSITQLFGTSGDDGTGILSRLANGVALAAVNYGESEDVVTSMFNQMTTALQNAGGSDNSGPRSVNGGPITENN
jgi:hypothetical protein